MIARLAAASVAGGITLFILGFVLYALILDPAVMKPNMNEFPGLMKETPLWVPLVLGNLVNAFLLAYIFDRWAGIRTFVGGVWGGAIVMFLIALWIQLFFNAFMNMQKNLMPAVADILGSTVLGGIAGGVIGMVLGMMGRNSTAAD
jgi:hypothetical protein